MEFCFILVVAVAVLLYIFYLAVLDFFDLLDSEIPIEDYNTIPLDSEIAVPSKIFNPKKVEAVVTCVGYADFLNWTLPFNKQHFDRLVVVTSPEDLETQRICSYWHVECVLTDAFYESGGFNKGAGINVGLDKLEKDGWVIHFDADIYLPPRTREILTLLPLDETSLYGIDRMNCQGFENFIKYLENPDDIHGNDGFLRLAQFSLGSRLLNLARDGYVPIGYFQMWCPLKSGVNTYPDFHTGADRTDTLFVYNWTREKRALIPELICIHLESEEAPMGINWKGRKSKPFKL